MFLGLHRRLSALLTGVLTFAGTFVLSAHPALAAGSPSHLSVLIGAGFNPWAQLQAIFTNAQSAMMVIAAVVAVFTVIAGFVVLGVNGGINGWCVALWGTTLICIGILGAPTIVSTVQGWFSGAFMLAAPFAGSRLREALERLIGRGSPVKSFTVGAQYEATAWDVAFFARVRGADVDAVRRTGDGWVVELRGTERMVRGLRAASIVDAAFAPSNEQKVYAFVPDRRVRTRRHSGVHALVPARSSS